MLINVYLGSLHGSAISSNNALCTLMFTSRYYFLPWEKVEVGSGWSVLSHLKMHDLILGIELILGIHRLLLFCLFFLFNGLFVFKWVLPKWRIPISYTKTGRRSLKCEFQQS